MNFGGKELREFKNVLTKEEHQECLRILNQPRWAFNNWSTDHEELGVLAWSAPLKDEPFFNTLFMNKIRQLTGYEYYVENIYSNGQTFGQDGVFHVDDLTPTRDTSRTFLYYATEIDDVDVYEYGGPTVFIQNDGKLYHTYPFTNTAVLFDGRIYHKGFGPTKRINKLRMTVAFKLYIQNK